MWALWIKKSPPSSEGSDNVEMEPERRFQASHGYDRRPSAMDPNHTPYKKASMLSTLKSIFTYRQPGYTPSPEALKNFQVEMERRLRLKSGGGDGVGRTANCYKMISIHPSQIPEDISYDRMMTGATYPVSFIPTSPTSFLQLMFDCTFETLLTSVAYQHGKLQGFLDKHRL